MLGWSAMGEEALAGDLANHRFVTLWEWRTGMMDWMMRKSLDENMKLRKENVRD